MLYELYLSLKITRASCKNTNLNFYYLFEHYQFYQITFPVIS